jgi:hypothetical protein
LKMSIGKPSRYAPKAFPQKLLRVRKQKSSGTRYFGGSSEVYLRIFPIASVTAAWKVTCSTCMPARLTRTSRPGLNSASIEALILSLAFGLAHLLAGRRRLGEKPLLDCSPCRNHNLAISPGARQESESRSQPPTMDTSHREHFRPEKSER